MADQSASSFQGIGTPASDSSSLTVITPQLKFLISNTKNLVAPVSPSKARAPCPLALALLCSHNPAKPNSPTRSPTPISINSRPLTSPQPASITPITSTAPIHPMKTRRQTGHLKPKVMFDLTHQLTDADPTSYTHASKVEHWCTAMSQEFQALQSQGTWDLVPPKPDQHILGCKWIYRTKRTSSGTASRYKARLVALGYNREFGIDYTDTFSPVAKIPTVRVLLVLALHENWPIHQLDVSNAFLHGSLTDTVQVREVVLEDMDISKAIVDYIATNKVHNVVVGASSRNAITRKFKNPDVPSNVAKSAPDFCTVYVISKGKQVSVRSARSPAPANHTPPRQAQPLTVAPSNHLGSDDSINLDIYCSQRPATSTPRESFSEDFDVQRNMGFRVPDFSESFEMNMSSITDISSTSTNLIIMEEFYRKELHTYHSTQANRDIEAEMKRLKLELKQTMDMYSTACKEAITSKLKAKELHDRKMEEARKVEEAKYAEEAALALVEREKARCKAAIEAAEAAQTLAEFEAQRRLNAELKAKHEAEEKLRALNELALKDQRYRKYNIDEIEIATEYFSESLKIGEGGYGPVYKASLDHTPVAIKVLRPDAAQGRKQFQQEVEVLSCIRHPNMVLLLGACPEYGCLVYEFMDNGSLEDRLFRRGHSPPIPWPVRFKIAAEIATALLFLHQAKPEPLVHRDLKPANILLDHNYTSKISDVGLSRLVPPSVADSVTQYRMTSTAGTFCYIDPEYQQTGMLGTKSDVYSLGVLLLQIITAKGPMGLTHIVERALERGTLVDLLDPTITNWPMEDVIRYTRLALKCSELRKKDRPDLGTVILPELNRLRNLGFEYQASCNSSSNGSTDGGSFGVHQRAKSACQIGLPTAKKNII
ncbi:U-box domain-containing protein 51-like [Dendrobium catenatum]|uniref:U-box domain-containing protein 51-like n=1 Tax=Dendrobium catenatum TaxID=906689 RepID=UPI00109FC104|nr:U-box domain-containing protein 51-like [Dendrobium catenatum]